VRLGAGPSSATLVNLHIVRRVALSQANIWSRKDTMGRRVIDTTPLPSPIALAPC
jgi:hypothetical protein